ncbi:hypothetical protein D1007_14092 [Hordeum vulgare]|nr:hypothetical protein D1007_14092 [Hordeum vulgare]
MATSLTSSRSRGSCSSPSIPLGRSSPIPYREGPLDYQPAIECDCGNKAARWISWSNANPGRRYVKCMRDRFPNRCNLFEFLDDPTPPHLAQLIIDLRDAVLSLKKEKQVVCTERDDLENRRASQAPPPRRRSSTSPPAAATAAAADHERFAAAAAAARFRVRV